MWYLVYYDNFNSCYIRKFLILAELHRFIFNHEIKDYKICESLTLLI